MEEKRKHDNVEQLEETAPEDNQEPENQHFADELPGDTDENVEGQATPPEELPEDQTEPEGIPEPEQVPSIAEGLPAEPVKEPPRDPKAKESNKKPDPIKKVKERKGKVERGNKNWKKIAEAIPLHETWEAVKEKTGWGRDAILKVKKGENLEFGSALPGAKQDKPVKEIGENEIEEQMEEKAASGLIKEHTKFVSDTALELDKKLIALGRHAYENYTARAGHWGVSIPKYLQFTTQFYENNSVLITEMNADFAEKNILISQQKQIIEQSFKILKTRTLVLDMLDKMMRVAIANDVKMNRDEIMEFVWAALKLEEKGI